MSVTLIALLGTYLMCWQGYKMRHRLTGLGHAGILVSLAATLLNSATARLSDAHPHSQLVGQFIGLIEHIFVIGSCLGLYVLRLAVEGNTIRDRRVQLTIGGGVLAGGLMTAATLAAISLDRLLSPTAASYRDLLGFTYAFGSGIYYGTVMFLVARWMWAYVRDLERGLRWGMRVAATGLYAISALCFGRALPVLVVFLGGPERIAPPWVLGGISGAAFPLVFLGLSYPLLVSRWRAYQAWRSRQRTCAGTRVLWRTCQTAYPEIVLRPSGIGGRARQLVSNHDILARLITESFDGLTKLLVHDAPVDTPAGRSAAADLREAVRRYDDTHAVAVAAIISPTVDEVLDDSEGVPDRPDTDSRHDIAMVLALAAELQTVIDNHHRVSA